MGEQFVNTRWLSNMAFEADVDGHKFHLMFYFFLIYPKLQS